MLPASRFPHLYRYLDTNGDGTGTKNAIGNYATATEFKIVPPSNQIYVLERLIVHVLDGGAFDAEKYGNGVTLTNGIGIWKRNGSGDLTDYCDSVPVVSNADWGRMCYDVTYLDIGTGDKAMNVRWTFSKAGQPVRLDGPNGEYFTAELEDNFSGLTAHYFMIQGYAITQASSSHSDSI